MRVTWGENDTAFKEMMIIIILDIHKAPCLSVRETPGASRPSISIHLKNMFTIHI